MQCRRVSGVIANRSEPGAQRIELVRREIQEIKDAFEAFKSAVEIREMTGFKDGDLRAQTDSS